MVHSTPNAKLINLASTEMAKGCIFLATGNENLERGDLVSCGVNTYYGLFHISVAILSLSSEGAFLESAIIDWKYRFKAKEQYLPISHNKLISLMKEIDSKLAISLEELKEIREYICYGPYLCGRSDPKWQPIIYTCEIESVKPTLESFYSNFSFKDVAESIGINLKEDWQKNVFSLWIEQTLKIFKESIGITDTTYRRSQEFWSTIRQAIFQENQW